MSDPTISFMQRQKEEQEKNLLELATAQSQNESKVGKILSESNQKAVITLVLSMLLSTAVLELKLFIDTPYAYGVGLEAVGRCAPDLDCQQAAFQAYYDAYQNQNVTPLLQLVSEEFYFSAGIELASLRAVEKHVSFYTDPRNEAVSVAVHDLRKITRLQAIMGILTTLAICTVLAMGSLFLSKVTQDLVLSPIEDMISKVKDITANPILAAQ